MEALLRLFRARGILSADPVSRFFGLRDAEIEDRLRRDREELDLWAVMMLAASFEVLHPDRRRGSYRTEDA